MLVSQVKKWSCSEMYYIGPIPIETERLPSLWELLHKIDNDSCLKFIKLLQIIINTHY